MQVGPKLFDNKAQKIRGFHISNKFNIYSKMTIRSIISRLLIVTSVLGCLAAQARAAATTLSFQPNPVDLNGLDHHYSYSWRIDNINLSNISVTSATLTFANIANWDSNPNMLFVYLMDTATQSGVNTFQDHPLNEVPIGDIVDHFANGAVIPSLITSSTAKTQLFQKSFTTTPTTYTYSFTTGQLATLTQYVNNGHDLAFGFDPECHFFNNGITFNMALTPVPEPAGLVPEAILLAAATALVIRRRRRAATCPVTR